MSRMAARLRDVSIKTKLALIVLATTAAALSVIGAVLALDDFLSYRQDAIAVLKSHAQITAIHASTAAALRDAESARQTLSALHVTPAIRAASIYDVNGDLFASFQRPGSSLAATARATALAVPAVTLTRVTLDHPVQFAGATIGFLRIEADFSGYLDDLKRFGSALLVATAGALAAALSLLIPLRRAMTEPIESLAGLIARVRRDKDYSLRAG